MRTFPAGNYSIRNCSPRSPNIALLLKILKHELQPSINDLDSEDFSPAYTAFFKDIYYAPFIKRILENVALGTKFPLDGSSQLQAPTIVCVRDTNEIVYREAGSEKDAYTECIAHASLPTINLLHGQPRAIILCPSFFEDKPFPPRFPSGCLTVDHKSKRFIEDERRLTRYQLFSLLYELVHFYVMMARGGDGNLRPVDACMRLRGERAIHNPQNFVYYVASEWTLLHNH